MAKESGWWQVGFTVEPSEADLNHIAELIKRGYTGGEIAQDEVELKWCDLCEMDVEPEGWGHCPICGKGLEQDSDAFLSDLMEDEE